MDETFVKAFIDELEKIAGKWVRTRTKLKYGVPAAAVLGTVGAGYGIGKGIKKGEAEAILEAQQRGRY